MPTGRSARKGVRVIPDRPGYVLDVPRSAHAVLLAALVTEPTLRSAKLIVERSDADRTTAEAKAMNIKGLVASYQTFYGGEANRIHNVQLVSHLVDKHVIAPGETFSFNGTTGARTADKGFREAPVIINGELQTGLGGGVCQVSTTVFNAAYEAGLPIVSRTNHALYISHYPQGRDATVNYPDTDLKFTNDTGHWLLLRTWVGSSSLTVALYGTPVHRRVVSDVAPLVVTGPPPVKKVTDPTPPERSDRGRGERVAGPLDERRAQGLRRRREAPLRHEVLLVVSRRGQADPGRNEAEPRSDRDDHDRHDDDHHDHHEDDEDYDDASALAIASARFCGIRIGRSVFASTQAWDVQPSAITSPPRVISYSNRKRAPRSSPTRAWIVRRSSKCAGWR